MLQLLSEAGVTPFVRRTLLLCALQHLPPPHRATEAAPWGKGFGLAGLSPQLSFGRTSPTNWKR